MDKSNILKLPVEEKEFFLNTETNDNWVQTVFAPYSKSLSIGIGIQNQFIDNVNQTVGQWKNHVCFMKNPSLQRFKRIHKHKIYIKLLGPFPEFFYYGDEFNLQFKNCIKMFLEIFFPGVNLEFLPVVDHRDLKVAKRKHEKSQQTQLFLPDIKKYLQKNLPKDALCICGLSWFDFFPTYELNHILGEGCMKDGTAAFSFGHYALFKENELLQAKNWKGDYVIEKPHNISDGLGDERKEQGCYDFVTESEKEEAKMFTLECDQEGCAGSKLNSSKNCFNSPLTLRGFFEQRRTSTVSRGSDSSEISITRSEAAPTAITTPVHDEVLEEAIPPDTNFNLNCKILRRLFRVMSHEICHVLGMTHCQYFSCTMNTSSSVLHSDTQPLLLCPVCLRKLHISRNEFRIKDRYEKLLQFLLLHTQVCETPGLHREKVIRMEETQVLSSNNVCLFKNDVQILISILEILREKSENFGFETVDAE